jgi:hypothetical protein
MVQRVLLAILAGIALAPVVGMVLVFAVLPALPIVILIAAMLGPSTLLGYAQQEEDEREAEAEHARYLRLRHAHAHAH